MDIVEAIIGPAGALVALALAVWAFYTRRVRPGADVIKLEGIVEQKDKTIEVTRDERDAQRIRAIEAEQALTSARSEIESLRARLPKEPRPPLV